MFTKLTLIFVRYYATYLIRSVRFVRFYVNYVKVPYSYIHKETFQDPYTQTMIK
jgi:hypothetical protein